MYDSAFVIRYYREVDMYCKKFGQQLCTDEFGWIEQVMDLIVCIGIKSTTLDHRKKLEQTWTFYT